MLTLNAMASPSSQSMTTLSTRSNTIREAFTILFHSGLVVSLPHPRCIEKTTQRNLLKPQKRQLIGC